MKVKKRKKKKIVEKVLKAIGVKTEVEDIWRLKKETREGEEPMLVKLQKESKRREILHEKNVKEEIK